MLPCYKPSAGYDTYRTQVPPFPPHPGSLRQSMDLLGQLQYETQDTGSIHVPKGFLLP